jgi:HlyD family secretion protein
MTKGRWILAAVILVVVGLATARGLRPRPPPPVEVTTTAVKRQNLTCTVSAAGHLQARETVKISSNVTGDLLALSIKEGDRVTKGQVLGQIDKRIEESQVTQLRSAVASAAALTVQFEAAIEQDERDVERARNMVAAGLSSKADLEKAQTQLKLDRARLAGQKQLVAQTQGQLESARYNLSRATLTAPIDGTILELNHKVGERILGSDFSEDVVLLMGGLADMEVKAEVGEHEVVGIHDGDEATIEIDAIPDQQFKGHVVAVGKNAQIKNPGTDAEVTSFFVRIGLDNPPAEALPGLSAAVSIATARRTSVLTVPIQAVASREPKKAQRDSAPASARDGGSDDDAGAKDVSAASAPGGKPKPIKVVFVVDSNGVAHVRAVRVGVASRTDVEILDGVTEGETIVDGPYRTLARELEDGQAVVVPPKDGTGDKGKGPRGSPS